MTTAFYAAGLIAVLATARVITAVNAVHALLYLIVSLLAIAVVFFVLGAPFAAALEIIIYAGAIMVLFVFVVMILNLGVRAAEQERRWLAPRMFLAPGLLAAGLLGELAYLLWTSDAGRAAELSMVTPKRVGTVLLGPYVVGVELASLLLLPGLVAAYHLGRRWRAPA